MLPVLFGSDGVEVVESLDGRSKIEANVRIGRPVRRMAVYLNGEGGWVNWAGVERR